MLADRSYMREPSYRSGMRLTTLLLWINIGVFILECILYGVGGGGLTPHMPEHDWFALSLWGLRHGYVWQLVTYQFMHAGLLHLFFNGWALFVFGRAIEETIGKPRFLTLYLASGVFGGLLQEGAAWLWPHYYNNYFGAPVVGASAAILGIVAAFAMIFPDYRLMVMFLNFSFPAKYLLFFSIIMAVLGISFPNTPFGGPVAHFAHFGGILAGMFYVQFCMNWDFRPRWNRRASRSPSRQLVGASAKRGFRSNSDPSQEDFSTTEFISREVDPILDKISAHGIQSLNERERKILEAARKKMGKH